MRAAVVLTAVLLTAACRQKPAPVHVVTTQEIAATGFVQQLVGAFVRQGSASVVISAVPANVLLAEVAKPNVDVVVTNDPAVVRGLANRVRLTSDIVHERFVLVGPSRDPARVHLAPSVADAMKRIVDKRRTFCSPADISFLKQREAMLWSAAEIERPKILECKGDGAAVLKEAARRQAYTIADRAVFDSVRLRGMKVFFENGPLLNNDYTALLMRTEKRKPDAEWFVEWTMSARAKETAAAFEAKRR